MSHGAIGGIVRYPDSVSDQPMLTHPPARINRRGGYFGICLLILMLSGVAGSKASFSDTTKPKIPTMEEINAAFGIPLLSTESLWSESDATVAGRLRLPRESQTTYESGYRSYTQTTLLGAKAFSIFLQGINGKVANISFLFANKGDINAFASSSDQVGIARAAQLAKQTKSSQDFVSPQMIEAYQAAIRKELNDLRTKLEGLFGPSKPAFIGIYANMQERGERWEWQGISFFLTAPRNEYIVLRLLPSSTFERTDGDRIAFQAAKALLPARVNRRPNGDVVITDLPMVDQGPKGYCVPATFERVMRYYGLQTDMNLLAMAGQTGAGGGTSLSNICNAAFNIVNNAGGRVTQGMVSVRVNDIAPYLDKGQPLIWSLYSSRELNQRANQRTRDRRNVTDWNAWKQNLQTSAKSTANRLPTNVDAHVCLIIGYNRNTGEVAISDSWGPGYQERWITQEEAMAASMGAISVIGW